MAQFSSTPPSLHTAHRKKQKYETPSFMVIELIMESQLLSGSSVPAGKKSLPVPNVNPIGNGGDL